MSKRNRKAYRLHRRPIPLSELHRKPVTLKELNRIVRLVLFIYGICIAVLFVAVCTVIASEFNL